MQGQKPQDKAFQLDAFLHKRDYVGAIAYLNFHRRESTDDINTLEWLAYAHYHNWEHAQVRILHSACRTLYLFSLGLASRAASVLAK